MKTAIRMVVLMAGLFATFAAVAAPFQDGLPRPEGRFTAVTAPVHQSAPDGLPRPEGR
jgi:hypothetical protein